MKHFIPVLFLLLFLPYLVAHGTEDTEEHDEETDVHASVWERLNLINPVDVLYAGTSVSILAIIVALITQNRLSEQLKKIIYIIIAVPVVIVTLYLVATTIYLNVVSETGGPVHWHADYQIWACGKQYELLSPEGIENRVGSPVLHEHNDNRIHIEGVVLRKDDVSLGEFFETVGGKFTEEEIILPTNDGLKHWKNGDLCSGGPAEWNMFVNGQRIEEGMDEYVISPYPDVPPGDCIILEFGSGQKDTTDRICESYRDIGYPGGTNGS